MNRILFGDNQFYGVNHQSDEKGKQNAIRFSNPKAILEILAYGNSIGLDTFVCSTRPQIIPLMGQIKNDKRFIKYKVYPTIPDVHKYNNALSEYGIIGTIKNILPNNLISFVAKGGRAIATKDVLSLLELVIDLEMKIFEGINTEVVFIQNNVTDLLLGLEMKDVFLYFSDYIKKKYNAEPGFMTMNLPKFIDFIEYIGIKDPIVCSSINKKGFRMFGGVALYEKYLREKKYRYVAMQPLAAGALKPEEAFSYIAQFENIESILFGSSFRSHILQSKELIQKIYDTLN